MAMSNPAAMLADSLSVFSKAAHKAFSEVEVQSRREVAQAVDEAREARSDRDRARKELHTLQMSTQSMMQEMAMNKAALVQAELTIARQVETLSSQTETITQLRRELSQTKDQSRNWQEHFLRVEQERCMQSSRIEELVAEKLQLATANALVTPKSTHGGSLPERKDPTSFYTPKSGRNVVQGSGSAQSKRSKAASTQPPSYESVGPRSPLSMADASPSVRMPTSQTNGKGRPSSSTNAQKSASKSRPQPHRQSQSQYQRQPEATMPRHPAEVTVPTPQKRQRKSLPAPQSAKNSEPPPRAVTTKLVRRVEAVIHVKQEDDSDEEDLSLSPNSVQQHPASALMKDVTRSSSHYDAQRQRVPRRQEMPKASGSRGRQRASRSRVIHDDDDEEEDEDQNEEEEDEEAGRYRSDSRKSVSEDEEDEVHAAATYNPPSSGRLRNLSRINYREEEDDVDDDEDELTMGAEDNHDEVYGTKPVGGPARKKRKVAG